MFSKRLLGVFLAGSLLEGCVEFSSSKKADNGDSQGALQADPEEDLQKATNEEKKEASQGDDNNPLKSPPVSSIPKALPQCRPYDETKQGKIASFKGAEGFGRHSKGGRGGDVYHVTNLKDKDPGSLRHGIESAKGPRTIVFEVSGTIHLEKPLYIRNSRLTLAGQTAPGGGITLRNRALVVKASDIVIRYLRTRLGDLDREASEDDALTIAAGNDIMIDHVSASWGIDEVLSNQSDTADRITVQWSIISEALHASIHPKGSHGMGGIVGSASQSFHHNLYAHNPSRNPKVTWRRHCKVDFRNNVVYNWKNNTSYDGENSHMNWVNNYYKPGPATRSKVLSRIFEIGDEDNDSSKKLGVSASLYAHGNFIENNAKVSENNWDGGIDFAGDKSEQKNRAMTPFPYPPITEQSAEQAYADVLSYAGASHKRDSLDERIISEVKEGKAIYGNNGIINSQKEVQGWPVLESKPAPEDKDRDGMADEWEVKVGLDPNKKDHNCIQLSEQGYTNLEVYLDQLVAR